MPLAACFFLNFVHCLIWRFRRTWV